jgi:cytochrome c553
MSRTYINLIAGLLVVLLSATTAFAGDSSDSLKLRIGAGDPVIGKTKSLLCQGCHGEDGNSATADFPKLAGQYAAYIQKQIRDFQAGARKDPIMSEMAVTVASEQDLLDISAYFASQVPMKGDRPVINQAGQDRFMKAGNGCVTCHEIGGKGAGPFNLLAPQVGGQHKDYLVKQLKAFKKGERNNEKSGMMNMILAFMSDADIEDVAGYTSGLGAILPSDATAK